MRHIASSKTHTEVVLEIRAKEEADRELKSKNQLAGINLGRICMKNYILGRPDTDYENDVLIVKKAGGVVGELNHSRMFPPAFRPSVTNVIHGRVKKFLETPMVQTGHLPQLVWQQTRAPTSTGLASSCLV